jgi:cytochrome c-type biogenesis protein CcmH
MIWLWIASALVSAALAALIVQRAARSARRVGEANPALAVYRRQMAELDELADRGLLAEDERRGVRAETGRRLLAAAGRAEPELSNSSPALILAAAAAIPLMAMGIYLAIGAPDMADQPFARRLAEWRAADPASLTAPQIAAVLRAVAVERPKDPEPLHNLAIAEFEAGQPLEAAQALQRAIALAPRRADLWELLGVTRVAQAGGEMDADAAAAFHQALTLDPTAAMPRYFLARQKVVNGDVAGGLADMKAVEASFAPDDPRRRLLSQDIAQVSATGKLATTAPMAAPDASAATSAAPSVGAPQIQAMVDGLAARLHASPDDPAGWVRLVRAYAVLGETDRESAALAEARNRFAGKADVLAALDAATHPPSPPSPTGAAQR